MRGSCGDLDYGFSTFSLDFFRVKDDNFEAPIRVRLLMMIVVGVLFKTLRITPLAGWSAPFRIVALFQASIMAYFARPNMIEMSCAAIAVLLKGAAITFAPASGWLVIGAELLKSVSILFGAYYGTLKGLVNFVDAALMLTEDVEAPIEGLMPATFFDGYAFYVSRDTFINGDVVLGIGPICERFVSSWPLFNAT